MPLRNVALVLICLSIFQYATQGEVTWYQGVFDKVGAPFKDDTTRPEAAWRKATNQLENIGASREGIAPGKFDLSGTVVRVADGDTISLLDENKQQHKIRLYGIDTPEKDQPWGDQSRKALANLIADQSVGVIVIETDDYGRNVGTVYLRGVNINEVMLRDGHAWWYQYYAPDERHLQAAQDSAREARRGLWQADAPTAPWLWRREQQR